MKADKLIRIMGLATVITAGILATGCTTTQSYSMVCFSPEAEYVADTPTQVLEDLNSEVPFPVSETDFACRRVGSEVLAWIVCTDRTQRSAVKNALADSEQFRFVSVGFFDARDRDMFLLGPGASDTAL